MTRLEREGYRFRVVAAGDVDATLRAELERVSAVWRGSNVERGFSMAMDDHFSEPETFFAIAERDGTVGGFLHLVPSGQRLLARCDAPRPGHAERLDGVSDRGADGLGARPRRRGDLAQLLRLLRPARSTRRATGSQAVARQDLRAGDRLFQLERLLVFSRKFAPEWRPRYLCVERLADLPLVGLAYLRVESLLTPPGPWARQRPVSLAPRE